MKPIGCEAACLEASSRAAGTRVVPAELFEQLLVAMHDAQAALYMGFRVEIRSGACSSSRARISGAGVAWDTFLSNGKNLVERLGRSGQQKTPLG
jgi:hypothetical protein